MIRASSAFGCAACAALLACGGGAPSSSSTSCRRASPPPPPVTVSGALRAQADREQVASGGAVTFTMTVTGPARYSAACPGPLQLIVVDRADLHVYSDAPAAPRGIPCGNVVLGGGSVAEYSVRWAPDPTLPGGLYHAVLTLGDQQPLMLAVVLAQPSGC
ncbi:MAG: hypothetical protein E6J14_00760 [Chloroflexi bacterium]|nr:MAG: hypothetical protein E6J14_00760 [Chloroflexota bacterium]